MSPDIAVDFDFIQTTRIVKYQFFTGELILHKSIIMYIILFDKDNNQVTRLERKVEGDEYDAWGVDDSYLEIIAQTEVEKLFKKPLTIEVEDVILEDVDLIEEIPTE